MEQERRKKRGVISVKRPRQQPSRYNFDQSQKDTTSNSWRTTKVNPCPIPSCRRDEPPAWSSFLQRFSSIGVLVPGTRYTRSASLASTRYTEHGLYRHPLNKRSMKASTWAALALCAGRAHPSGAAAGGDQCDVVCGAIKSEVSSSEACAKARKSLPRPKIGHICQVGSRGAWCSTAVYFQ